MLSTVLVVALASLGAAPGDKEGLAVGAEAPSFSMKTINAKRSGVPIVALRRYVGDKPDEAKKAVVLSFAASYCDPCKKELAELKAMKERLDKAGVLLAVVVIDTEEPGIAKMRALVMDELDLPFPVLSDRFNIVARRYRADTLPHVVVIDAAGKVSWVHSGFAEGSLDELMKRLGA